MFEQICTCDICGDKSKNVIWGDFSFRGYVGPHPCDFSEMFFVKESDMNIFARLLSPRYSIPKHLSIL